MRPHRSRPTLVLRAAGLLSCTLLLLACGPSNPGGTAVHEAPVTKAPAFKTLVMGERGEPTSVVLYGRLGEGGVTTARYERFLMFHGNLTAYDTAGNAQPRAAVKIPSLQDGDWQVASNGTMAVTWRIRPDVFWHDGTPLTADDFALGFEVVRDPKLAVGALGEISKMASLEVLDAHTLRINWKTISNQGNVNPTEGVPAIPKHLLGEPYRTLDAPAFAALAAWTSEFVGIGPYRVSKFEVGVEIEGQAFEQYYLGRPRIDRVTIRWASDTPVMIAQLLAGAVDYLAPGGTASPEQLVQIKRQWGSEGTVSLAPVDVRILWLNLRVDGQPWAPGSAGWQRDRRFRQAMLYAMDRQHLADELQYGFSPVLYFPAFPDFPIYQLALQRGLPKYEYNPTRAAQLFAEAGWHKGSDGLLHNSEGQVVHFPCCRYGNLTQADVQESLGWGVDFLAAGLEVENPIPVPLTAGLSASEQRRVQTVGWGGTISNWRITSSEYFASLVSTNTARAETGWSGINTGAWANAGYDNRFSRVVTTLEPAPRLEAELEMLRVVMDELPIFPVYNGPIGFAARKGLTGISQGAAWNHANTDDIHLWDITS